MMGLPGTTLLFKITVFFEFKYFSICDTLFKYLLSTDFKFFSMVFQQLVIITFEYFLGRYLKSIFFN